MNSGPNHADDLQGTRSCQRRRRRAASIEMEKAPLRSSCRSESSWKPGASLADAPGCVSYMLHTVAQELHMAMTPKKSKQSVTSGGEHIAPMIEGILVRQQVTQQDHRGSLTEIYSPFWEFDAI